MDDEDDDPRIERRGRTLWRTLGALVARRGRRQPRSAAAARLRRHELSVVACDLRGYTRFSAAVRDDEVVELLRQHYLRIGEIVASHRGTIKDHAGDGTLVLVGARRPSRDHADRAIAMAREIAARTEAALRGWRRGTAAIGLGIGVASGEVTFGTIEAGRRLETVAVGTAVNLAARLCARARPGQILVDARTVTLAANAGVEPLETADIDGFAAPVPIFRALAP